MTFLSTNLGCFTIGADIDAYSAEYPVELISACIAVVADRAFLGLFHLFFSQDLIALMNFWYSSSRRSSTS